MKSFQSFKEHGKAFLKQVQTEPFPFIAGAAGITGAGLAGVAQFEQDRNLPLEGRLTTTGMQATRGLVAGVAAAGAGMLVWNNRRAIAPVFKGAAEGVHDQVRGVMQEAGADYTFMTAKIPRNAAHKAALESAGIKPIANEFEAATAAYGRNGKIMLGGGAAAGAVIGSAYGHPVLGAAVGAGAGLAVKAGLGVHSTWEAASKFPGLRTAGILGVSTAIFAGASAISPHEYQLESEADSDTRLSGVRDRVQTMKATGDIVFGMNQARHG